MDELLQLIVENGESTGSAPASAEEHSSFTAFSEATIASFDEE